MSIEHHSIFRILFIDIPELNAAQLNKKPESLNYVFFVCILWTKLFSVIRNVQSQDLEIESSLWSSHLSPCNVEYGHLQCT